MKESFSLSSHHICGGLFRICNTCNRQFCSKCEASLYIACQTKELKSCCRKAIIEFCTMEDKRSEKIKTKITEITDGKL